MVAEKLAIIEMILETDEKDVLHKVQLILEESQNTTSSVVGTELREYLDQARQDRLNGVSTRYSRDEVRDFIEEHRRVGVIA